MATIHSRNIIGLGLFSLVLLSFAFFYFQPKSPSHKPPQAINQLSIEKKDKASEAHRNETNINNSTINEEVVPKTNAGPPNLTALGTAVEAEEIKQWYRERGKFFGDYDTEYKNYDEFALRKLADTGDIRALHALAELYIDEKHRHLEGYGLKATDDLFWKAAAYGSTEALYHLGLNLESTSFPDSEPETETRKRALEILSLYNTAALRGDELPNILDADYFKRSKGVIPSDDEKKFIEQRSQEIYNEILQKRLALGLGDFDNSQPESVRKYFTLLKENRAVK